MRHLVTYRGTHPIISLCGIDVTPSAFSAQYYVLGFYKRNPERHHDVCTRCIERIGLIELAETDLDGISNLVTTRVGDLMTSQGKTMYCTSVAQSMMATGGYLSTSTWQEVKVHRNL